MAATKPSGLRGGKRLRHGPAGLEHRMPDLGTIPGKRRVRCSVCGFKIRSKNHDNGIHHKTKRASR